MKILNQLLGKFPLKGDIVTKFTGEGCQARDDFHWIGKVDKITTEKNGVYKIICNVIKYNHSYSDIRMINTLQNTTLQQIFMMYKKSKEFG